MSGLATLRILFGRFLALYRWNIVSQTRSLSSQQLNRQYTIQKNIIITLQSIGKNFLDKKLNSGATSDHIIRFPSIDIAIKQNPCDIAARLIQMANFPSNYKLFFTNNILYVINHKEYSFKIHISSSGKIRLRSFSVQWPKEIQFLETQFRDQYVSVLSQTAKTSSNPIYHCCSILHLLYQIGNFSSIYFFLSSIQKAYGFQLSPLSPTVFLTFPESFSPSNIYTLTISRTHNHVILSSKLPVYNPKDETNHKQYISYELITNHDQIESIISEICQITYYTRLTNIWHYISLSLSTISGRYHFGGTFNKKLNCIEIYLFKYSVMRISINTKTSDVEVHSFGGIGMDPQEFIQAMEGCECQRNAAIKIVFLHSLSKLLFKDILGSTPQSRLSLEEATNYEKSVRVYKLSYSKDCSVIFGDERILPLISIASSDHSYISTSEIILVKSCPENELMQRMKEAAQSSKIAAILKQLVNTLKENGIAARIENSCVHFIVEPFDCVDFQISQNETWSLKFIKPLIGVNDILKLVFVGKSINSRFIDWIYALFLNVSAIVYIFKQAYGIKSLHTILKDFEVHNKTNFTLTMSSSVTDPIYSSLNVSMSNIELLKSNQKKEVYLCNPNLTPKINFRFSHYVQLKQHLETLLKSRSICYLFGSFLNSSFIPLQYFFDVFMGDPANKNWSIFSLRDDGSFSLVFQGSLSINFMLRPSQMFHLTIPSIGNSKNLQIPLDFLPKLNHPKISHPSLRIHMSQLVPLKTSIEQFFRYREVLSDIGFGPFTSNGSEFVARFPTDASYISATVYILPTKIEFEVEGPDAELNKAFKNVLDYSYEDDIETQVLAIQFVRNILVFDQKFVKNVLQFLENLIDKTKNLKLDWKTTFEISAVTLSEQKVIIRLHTKSGTYSVEITKKDGEALPEIICFDRMGMVTKIKNLLRWIETIEQSDDE